MKTSTLFISALLVLQAFALLAANTDDSAPAPGDATVIDTRMLAPVPPAIATFEDFTFPSAAELAPATPGEATFEAIPSDEMVFTGLAPVTPVTADFSEEPRIPVPDATLLSPSTPAEANFD